ncbi:MAG: hypothetical protein OEW87_13850 [Flavobacteriaceae bacterium]|nr:hypothetical protein [Flavobacteriaceae bacterium]
MTQITLKLNPSAHDSFDDDCPFCQGKKEGGTYTTYRGEKNSSIILRAIMKDPSKLKTRQKGARPKDGKGEHQQEDEIRYFTSKTKGIIPSSPIFKDCSQVREKQDYSDEAHHALSGKQILNNHKIEKFTSTKVENTKVSSDTGYSVNNCANGVALPSYPKYYRKRDSSEKWTNVQNKEAIMELPMAANKGQVHIGGHDIEPLCGIVGDEDDDEYDDGSTESKHGRPESTGTSYPEKAKLLLDALYDRIVLWAGCCYLCDTQDKNAKFPPPYRVNQYLDNISTQLIRHVKYLPPIYWRWFLSEYARNYTISLKEEKSGRTVIRNVP